MIHLYTANTPNGLKAEIMLHECAVEFAHHPVNITEGEQFKPEFLAISPNNKIPALVDEEGPDGAPISLFESGAILIYLAEKFEILYPANPHQRYEVLQWLMFQMGGLGPFLGQAHHFRRFAPESVPYAIERYTKEAARLYGVLNTRLQNSRYVGGDSYSIADIACYPWIARHPWQGVSLEQYPEIKRWFGQVEIRPAVQKTNATLRR